MKPNTNDHGNRLAEEHLNDTIKFYTSKCGLGNFPYETALKTFLTATKRKGYGLAGAQRYKVVVNGALDPALWLEAMQNN